MVSLFLSLFTVLALLASPCHAALAKVNGEAIEQGDVALFSESKKDKTPLDRAILFRLAIQDAKRRKLDRRPEVKQKMELALYESYLQELLSSASIPFEPSAKELEAAYQKSPMVRLRHLVLFDRTEEEHDKALLAIPVIQKRVAAGESFQKLVLEHSNDASKSLGGDLDFRTKDQLPPVFYETALKLKVGEVSAAISHNGAIHFIELMGMKPFSDLPEAVRIELKGQTKREREQAFLSEHLTKLRRQARIEIPSTERRSP